MFFEFWPVAAKTIMTLRYIALLKECELSVGTAAINLPPSSGVVDQFH